MTLSPLLRVGLTALVTALGGVDAALPVSPAAHAAIGAVLAALAAVGIVPPHVEVAKSE